MDKIDSIDELVLNGSHFFGFGEAILGVGALRSPQLQLMSSIGERLCNNPNLPLANIVHFSPLRIVIRLTILKHIC